MNKKEILAKILFSHKIPFLRTLVTHRKCKHINILAYHRVCDHNVDSYPFVKGTISATSTQFENQLEIILEKFNVINFKILKEMIDSEKKLPPNLLIITFDDGYKDNKNVAYPILKKYDCTATVFVSTGFIEKGNIFWFDDVAYRIFKMPDSILNLNSISEKFELKSTNRQKILRRIAALYRNLPNTARLKLIAELTNKSDLAIPAEECSLAAPCEWNDLQEMHKNGIEIASHTVSHPLLSTMTEQEIRDELMVSKQTLESYIQDPVVSISYPFGSYDERVERITNECGYEFGIAYSHGSTPFSEDVRFHLPRIHVERDLHNHTFNAALIIPELFGK